VARQLQRLDCLRRDAAPALEREPRAEAGVVRVAAAGQVDPGWGRAVEQTAGVLEELLRAVAEPVGLHADPLQHRLPAELDPVARAHQASALAAFAWTWASAVTGS